MTTIFTRDFSKNNYNNKSALLREGAFFRVIFRGVTGGVIEKNFWKFAEILLFEI